FLHCKSSIEVKKSMSAIIPQIPRQATQCHSTAVSIQENFIHLARRPHPVGSEHQVGDSESLLRPKIRSIFQNSLSKACGRFFETFAGAAAPEVPAFPDEVFRLRHFQAVAQL